MHLLCLCDLRLHHWIANWSHWLHLNLVPTYLWLCVLSKYFWVASWSLITLFTFEHSCQGLCGESTLPNDVLFLKCKLKRNHQDTITFKYNFNLLGTIVCIFILFCFFYHTVQNYIWFIHVDSVYASWDFILELLYYHTSYIHIWSHHVGLVCFYESLIESLYHTGHIYILSCMFISNVPFKWFMIYELPW